MHVNTLPSLQAGQSATLAAKPKSAAKPKKAAAGSQLSEDAKSAMALVEAIAAELPELQRERWAVVAGGVSRACCAWGQQLPNCPRHYSCQPHNTRDPVIHCKCFRGLLQACGVTIVWCRDLRDAMLSAACSLTFAPSGLFGGVVEERPPPNPDSKVTKKGTAGILMCLVLSPWPGGGPAGLCWYNLGMYATGTCHKHEADKTSHAVAGAACRRWCVATQTPSPAKHLCSRGCCQACSVTWQRTWC